MTWPGEVDGGPLFVMPRSACWTMFVVADEVLSLLFGSLTADDAEALLVIEAPAKFEATGWGEVIVAVCAGASVPALQGNCVTHAPLFETNARPAGVTSVTTI